MTKKQQQPNSVYSVYTTFNVPHFLYLAVRQKFNIKSVKVFVVLKSKMYYRL